MTSKIPYILTPAGRDADLMKQGIMKITPAKKAPKGKTSKYGYLGKDFFTKGW